MSSFTKIPGIDFKKLDRRMITIMSIVFVQWIGASMILPILPLYAKRLFSLNPTTVTLLVSSYFVAQFFAGPYLGQLSDQYGRIPILIISQIGSAISFFMIAIAPNAWILFAARILDGITGGNLIVAQAYVTDITPKEKWTESFGYLSAGLGIGFVIGPALGGLLSAAFGPRIPLVFAGIATAATVWMTWRYLDETITLNPEQIAQKSERITLSPADVLANAPLLIILMVTFLGQFGVGMMQSTFALFSDAVIFRGMPESTSNLGIGLLLGVVGIGQLFTQILLIVRVQRRFGDTMVVVIGSGLRAFGSFLLAISLSFLPASIACVFLSVGIGLIMPPLQTLSTSTVVESKRGAALGVFQSSVSLAIIVSTAISGLFFTIHPTLPSIISGIFCVLVVFPGSLLLFKSQNRDLIPQLSPAVADCE